MKRFIHPHVQPPRRDIVGHRRGAGRAPLTFGAVAALLGTLVSGGWGTAAASAASPRDRTVTSGNARFEVLSPTLIRTEYAGDARFVDAGSFNAVGRDAFPATAFSASTRDGWLTIATAAVTLKY